MTSSIWLNDLAAYALQAALLVGAGALLARLFRLRACTAILAYWQVLLAACLLLPICQPWKTHVYTINSSEPHGIAGIANSSAPAPGRTLPERQPKPVPVQETVLLIIAAGGAVYGNSLGGVFVFDDLNSLARNPAMRHLWPLSAATNAPKNTTLAGRPVASLSFAANYAWMGSARGALDR